MAVHKRFTQDRWLSSGRGWGPPFRAAARTDPYVRNYRVRLLLRVLGVEAFVGMRGRATGSSPATRRPASGVCRQRACVALISRCFAASRLVIVRWLTWKPPVWNLRAQMCVKRCYRRPGDVKGSAQSFVKLRVSRGRREYITGCICSARDCSGARASRSSKRTARADGRGSVVSHDQEQSCRRVASLRNLGARWGARG